MNVNDLMSRTCLAVVVVAVVTLSLTSANVAFSFPGNPPAGGASEDVSDKPSETKMIDSTPEQVAKFFADKSKKVLTFMGFSGAGYEDEEEVHRRARKILESHSPDETIVNIGATEEGIGKLYQLAKSMGFMTTGIVSTQAKKYDAALSDHVDVVFFIEDETWGGFMEDEKLSPTSQAMVESSDFLVAFGGGEVTRDELTAAERMGKKVRFVVAEMNHATAIDKAKKKNLPAPTDFYGAAYEKFGKGGSGQSDEN